MSLTKKVDRSSDIKLSTPSKATTLNPNAAEFIPFSVRSLPSGFTCSETPGLATSASAVGKALLDRSASSASSNPDEEAHQYWHHRLPDDITPDFNVFSEDDPQGPGSLSLAGLSLHDTNETSSFPASVGGGYLVPDQVELPSHLISGNSLSEKKKYSSESYGVAHTQTNCLHLTPNPWDDRTINGDQLLGNVMGGYSGNSGHGLINDVTSKIATIGDLDVNHVEFLASQFPGFSAESLAEVYFANGSDLRPTIQMLTQLELQVDGGLNQNLNPKTLLASNHNAVDFPALSVSDSQSIPAFYAGDGFQQTGDPYRSAETDNLFFSSGTSVPSRSLDFAAAVRKMASQDSGMWKYERNDSVDSTVGSSRNSHGLTGVHSSAHGKSIYAEKLQNRVSAWSTPVWLETGDGVASTYLEQREEARDHARLCNAYFEQARRAYFIGNKALAKELCVKGQLHNMHMKAAHGKAQEAIYRQRSPVGQDNVKGHEGIIDLRGLQVSEAINVLKHELNVLRSTAHATNQRLQVYICMGTGHHTSGSRTPAAVQRYLLEEEGLDYNVSQPGLLRVVIY